MVYQHWTVQPYTDPITPGTWQGSLYSVSFEVPGCSKYTGTCQRTWCRSDDQAVRPSRGPLLYSLFRSISWTEGLTYTQLSMAEDGEGSCWYKSSRERRMQTLCLLLSRPSPDHQATEGSRQTLRPPAECRRTVRVNQSSLTRFSISQSLQASQTSICLVSWASKLLTTICFVISL